MSAHATASQASDRGDVPKQPSLAQPQTSTPSCITEDATVAQGASRSAVDFPEDWDARFSDVEIAGRGGMATVFRAFDTSLSRPVALKLMRADVSGDLEVRFRREAAAMARLSHPNIVSVYDTGVGKGHMWMALEWIDGHTLSETLKAREIGIAKLLTVLVQTARALQHAHERGIVHRDLKPSNILVTGASEAKVADFGIAHFLADDSALTRTDAAIGTPLYMAPEQADPQRGAITVRTDVYALGVILYEVLSGVPPHRAEGFATLVHAIIHDDPVPLRHRDESIDVDLEAIALKALEKDPARRYGSAAAFADDLEAYLAGDPVSARRQTAWYRLAKRARKHKLAVSLGTLAMVATLSSSAWGAMSWMQSVEQTRIAQRFGQRVERIEAIARRSELVPLHDLSNDHDIIRAQMASIRDDMVALGELATGPGHYALGRGHLALGEPDQAEAELARAWEHGYRTPETAAARGLALGQLYSRERMASMRIPDATLRAEALERLVTQYRTPALEMLRRAEGATGDAPEYAEALIAVFERRYDDALAKAQAAYTRLPWFHDAMRLEGAIHLELAQQLTVQADIERHVTLAHQAYARAVDVGRSDFESHAGLCNLGSTFVHTHAGTARATTEAKHFLDACRDALTLVPNSAAIHHAISETHVRLSENAVRLGGDAQSDLRVAIEAAQRAIELDASAPDAHRSLGFAQYTLANLRFIAGQDPRSDIDRAVTSLERTLELRPDDAFARTHLGLSHGLYGKYLVHIGRTVPAEVYERGLEALRLVDTNSDRLLLSKWINMAAILASRANFEWQAGLDPTSTFAEAIEALDAALAMPGKNEEALVNKARILVSQSQYQNARGIDAASSIEQAYAGYLEALEASHSNYHYAELGSTRLLAAENERLFGRPERMEPFLAEAYDYFQRAHEASPELEVPLTGLAQVAYYRAHHALRMGQSPMKLVEESLRWLSRAQAQQNSGPRPVAFKAFVIEPALRWLAQHGGPVQSWLDRAIADLKMMETKYEAYSFSYDLQAKLYRIVAEHAPRPDWIEAGLHAASTAAKTGDHMTQAMANEAILLAIAVDQGLRPASDLDEAQRLFTKAVGLHPRIAHELPHWNARLLDGASNPR